MNPFVSIVIPVYYGSNYLAEAIDSALNQTYKNIEIIVVNDGSTDDGATENIALKYGDKIRYFSKENGGVSTALNRGIQEMRGEYFSWLSHDDLYAPDKIEKEIALIKNNKDIVLCSGSLMDVLGESITHHTKLLNTRLDGRQLFKEFLHGYVLNGLGFLIPKQVFDEVGCFDEGMRYLQDLDLWLRMMWFDYTFVCTKELLVVSRVHKGQTTNIAADLFDVDRVTLAKKHALLIEKTYVENRDELFKLYLLLFEKSNNRYGIEVFKRMFKENGGNILGIYFFSMCYRFCGGLKSMYRLLRDRWLTVRNMRSGWR